MEHNNNKVKEQVLKILKNRIKISRNKILNESFTFFDATELDACIKELENIITEVEDIKTD